MSGCWFPEDYDVVYVEKTSKIKTKQKTNKYVYLYRRNKDISLLFIATE